MATCTSCSAELAAGSRWCNICFTNVVDPAIGRLASPIRRLWGHLFDVLIITIDILLFFVVIGIGTSTGTEGGSTLGVLLALGLIIGYIVWALMLFGQGTSPGKFFLGLRVIREDGRRAGFWIMLVREWIGKAISSLVFSLGFLWILFDKDNQGWHDKLMNTYVVNRRHPDRVSIVGFKNTFQ